MGKLPSGMRAYARTVIVASIAWLVVVQSSQAAWTYSETFNGGYDHPWSFVAGVFPNESTSLGIVNYLGAPTTEAALPLAGAQTLRWTSTMSDLSRRGRVSLDTLPGAVGQVETRFNTLSQDSTHIDGLLDLWLVNPNNRAKFARVSLFGADFSTNRRFVFASSVDGEGTESFNYQSNTWYRLRIDATGPQLLVSLLSDEGSVLVSHLFTHSLATLGDQFQIGLAQYVGTPGTPSTTDVAIDSVIATPEPGTAAIMFGISLVVLARARRA